METTPPMMNSQRPTLIVRAGRYLSAISAIAGISGCGQEQNQMISADNANTPEVGEITGIDEVGPAVATASAERLPMDINSPAYRSVPPSVLGQITRNVISYNSCSANLVIDNETGETLGVSSAGHCARFPTSTVPSPTNILWFSGSKHATLPRLDVHYSSILKDPVLDIAYIGLNGHSSQEVQQQMIDNYNQADIPSLPINSLAVMAGFPYYNNPNKELKVLELAYGGITNWATTYSRLAFFGDWLDGVSCSPQSSGSGIYVFPPGKGPLLVGVLSTRAEFAPVRTMPYGPSYGLEVHQALEVALGRKINAQFMCGFATPILPQSSNAPGARTERLPELDTVEDEFRHFEDEMWKQESGMPDQIGSEADLYDEEISRVSIEQSPNIFFDPKTGKIVSLAIVRSEIIVNERVSSREVPKILQAA